MNGIQSRKAQNINVDKQFPGCLGRMVNLFDMSTSVSGNRLLMDKPHYDGASLSRSRSDVARIVDTPFVDQIEDKLVVSEFRRTSSNKKANCTPMKTLISHEMSIEVECKHNPPNVVAKLMGLDALPHQQPCSAAQRSHSKGYSRHSLSHSEMPVNCWEQDPSFLDNQLQAEVHQCHEQKTECKDVYEIWQQSQKASYSRDSSMQKGRFNEHMKEEKMALVRQKFMEAKCLATDEKLRQSKEFQDALEVLSSNRDLFLRFLQEPNSLISQHMYDLQSIPPPPETKRITVLRPSKMVDDKLSESGKKNDKQAKKPAKVVQATEWERKSSGYSPVHANQKGDDHPTQSTRIVVLKPSLGKTHDIKAMVSPPSSLPGISHGEDFFEEPEDDEVRESREVAKEITQQMRENLMGHRRDETLLSSVFSNGYIGDESSFNKSENDFGTGNLSDSEAVSPTSRHSWDYINRFGSPYSSSSFSRASCSPESSVCREAKKRLSERWAMMTLNGNSQEQRHIRRSSSTLGEMLALSDTKKSMRSADESSTNGEQEPRGSTSYLTTSILSKEEDIVESPRNLMRSKSLPVSSTAYGTRLNVEVSDHEAVKTQCPKELAKTKSTKSSLKGKVSSLFFLRNKKPSKEKSSELQSEKEFQSVTADRSGSDGQLPGKSNSDASQCLKNSGHGEGLSPGLQGSSSKTFAPDLTETGQKQGIISQEAGLSVARPLMPVHVSENPNQPSPISVLEAPFEEGDHTIFKPDHQGMPLKSNLIDKSPPIESIARTLSWDDSCTETAISYSLKPSSVSQGVEEGQDWLFLVQILISAAGLDGEVQSKTDFARWHSPESPLDPSLRDKYANLNDKEPLHEAKRRQWRSNRKLVFDCVNTALAEITGYGTYGSESDRRVGGSGGGAGAMVVVNEVASGMVVEQVWGRMKEWVWGEEGCGGGDSDSLVVERVVRKEVVGKGWGDRMRVELDNMGKEIEMIMLEELVDEAVVALTGRLL
ncbi:hypothetical protein Ddye_016342 [Dipteronia dyeriana]|uniref:Uncharacterized protein n=1 Tax=Dipteronia dyeriana TaxID=168575 RepID=A0AAD9U778_9ROSI|nr:hypothetical protein Ddye_016342 [Dipteronia dyeriana]